MSFEGDPADPADPAGEAFERLRLEVALLRRAVEGQAGEGDARPPDYSPTLAKLGKAVAAVDTRVQALGDAPLLALSPAELGRLLQHAAEVVTGPSLAELAGERTAVEAALRRLDTTAPARDDGRRGLRRMIAGSVAGLVIGALSVAALSGPIARALPARLQAPERLAAAVIGAPREQAGWRLLTQARPDIGRRLELGEAIVANDPRAAEVCLRRAERMSAKVRCVLEVSPLRSAAPAPPCCAGKLRRTRRNIASSNCY